MAAALTRSMISTWSPAAVSLPALNGFHRLRVWERMINHSSSNEPSPLLWRSVISVSVGLLLTQLTASDVLSPLAEKGNPGALFFQNYESAFAVATFTLVVLNGITIFAGETNKNVSDFPSQLDQFRLAVWKTTPYLMLVTNIALLIIDIPQSKGLGLISLATAAITLIDLTSWKPEHFDWYLDVGFRVPLGIAVMYYHENMRIPILIGFSLDLRIQETFKNCINRLI
jgi:hypothetical protein